jgi:tripartite-type tricarboxylate transporter receptor subunit TctC
MLTRRIFSVLLPAAALGLWARDGAAQGNNSSSASNFPTGLVRIIVPFPPGGGTDVLARLLSSNLQNLWGQSVILENRPGAAGLIGTRAVAAAAPDGHTLLMASTGAILALASAPAEGAAATPGAGGRDIARELAPVSLVAAPPYILVTHPSVPAATAAELIQHAKRHPGALSFGSSGVGSASHLSGALFAQMAGIELLHVPYRGTAPAVTDLLGGRIALMFAPALTVTPHLAAGTLRALGVTAGRRSALFPEIPPIAETGLPDYESLGWFGLFAPAGTPRETVAKISADVGNLLRSAEAKQRLAEQGAEPAPNSPEEFLAFVRADLTKWLTLTEKAGIRISN